MIEYSGLSYKKLRKSLQSVRRKPLSVTVYLIIAEDNGKGIYVLSLYLRTGKSVKLFKQRFVKRKVVFQFVLLSFLSFLLLDYSNSHCL